MIFQQNVSVHQIRPTQRIFTTSITFPPPVNQLPTSAVGFGWHGLFGWSGLLVEPPLISLSRMKKLLKATSYSSASSAGDSFVGAFFFK